MHVMWSVMFVNEKGKLKVDISWAKKGSVTDHSSFLDLVEIIIPNYLI